ncbi:universal stress protein [Stappia sp. GBMRC 2046]|uniref:Universal stress protein n=1 Tax=Stappia sediminis TaxID=2692190 RepID=A0A7X3LSS3_9HYPH|nr:universal stress protein [Stappia sediminis]MXN64413.1 universal stress protein [Stappia sediminis]
MTARPVLCAVDVSNKDRDIGVLKQAARLAANEGSRLDVVTVVPDFGMSIVGTFFGKDHLDMAMKEARKLLDDLVSTSLGPDANAQVRHIVVSGSAYEEILRIAEADNASLIVIGAHKPDFKDYLLGPNAARIVRHSNCSVLVVR